MTCFATYYRIGAAFVLAASLVIPGSLWAQNDSLSSIIETDLQRLQAITGLMVVEEVHFDELVQFSKQAAAPDSQQQAAIAFPIAEAFHSAEWSESAAYEEIRSERQALIQAAEAAARFRAARSARSAQINAAPLFPAGPENHIQGGEALIAVAKPSRAIDGGPEKLSTVALLSGRLDAPVVAGVGGKDAAPIRLQYYAIRNGYHGGRSSLEHLNHFPALRILSISSPAPSRATRAPRPKPFLIFHFASGQYCSGNIWSAVGSGYCSDFDSLRPRFETRAARKRSLYQNQKQNLSGDHV
ncbi:MAG: hypothetical protein NXI24_24990 [bacterium]|nr:hypothetical protein [bacterium]